MRLFVLLTLALVVAAPAAAATPKFGVFNLNSDLAPASHNEFGDVHVSASETSLARKAPGATLARCAAGCRLGRGWLAFTKASPLAAGDLSGARATPGLRGWTVSVTLSPRGQAHWRSFSRAARARAKRNGLPDALVVVIDGRILAQPLASEVRHKGTTLLLTGFYKADALRAAKVLG